MAVPFCGSYLGSYEVIPKKEPQWSLWVHPRSWDHLGPQTPSLKRRRPLGLALNTNTLGALIVGLGFLGY